MKILFSVFIFALTLAFTSPSVAAEGGGGHGGGLTEKMNALFPPPKSDATKRAVPAKPELESPAYFAKVNTDKVTLTWKAVDTADEYHVQVATDANFKWLAVDNFHVKGTTFEAANLQPGKHYYWRVAAVKSTNWSTFRKSYFAMSMFETPSAQ